MSAPFLPWWEAPPLTVSPFEARGLALRLLVDGTSFNVAQRRWLWWLARRRKALDLRHQRTLGALVALRACGGWRGFP